jgi:hypothetical protein
MRQQWRHFLGDPSVNTRRPFVDGLQEISGAGEVFQRQLEEQRLGRHIAGGQTANVVIVGSAMADSVIEDGRVRRWVACTGFSSTVCSPERGRA